MKADSGRSSRILRPALCVLAFLALAWGANQWQLKGLERELQTIADGKLLEFETDTIKQEKVTRRMAAKVVVSMPYVFWGTPEGKVSVFVGRTREGDGEYIEGFDFFFARGEDASWTQTESGICASEQCSIEGKELLDALGAQF